VAYPFAQFDTRTPPAAEGYVPSFLSKLPFARRSSKGTTGGYRKPPANQHVLEALEPRVLLAADLSFGAATDLTLPSPHNHGENLRTHDPSTFSSFPLGG